MKGTQTMAQKIQKLRLTQRQLARRIDHAQMKDNISELLALEARYKQLALKIEQVQQSLKMNSFESSH